MGTRKRIVILGGSFAGMTAAIELKEKLGDEADVVVLSKAKDFLFMPSLIWVPFGKRQREDITFALAPVFEKKGVDFRNVEVTRIDLPGRKVETSEGAKTDYDFLVIATGPKLDYAAVKGLGPGGHTQSIFSWDDAVRARDAFERFVADPGPVVVGGVQGASCYGAAYEFLFNMAYELKKRDLAHRAPLTYVTSEPFLAHFGIGGFGNGTKMTEMFMRHMNIDSVTNASVREFTKDEVHLEDGRRIPFRYAMFAPRFLGIDPVRALEEITTPAGFVRVDARYRTERYPEVYAAGVAVAIDPPQKTPVPCGVPKTGYLSEEMARVVAHNIVATIHGEPLVALPPGSIDAKCVLDAGNNGIIMTSDHFLEPRAHAWLIPGPEAHWAKLAFEKYFLATHRRGQV
ncbi:MAG TPA: FAD-dependent oxidoreductase [Polyangiaceae bacterium]|jgi:sulfide:quinone oxidoreductase